MINKDSEKLHTEQDILTIKECLKEDIPWVVRKNFFESLLRCAQYYLHILEKGVELPTIHYATTFNLPENPKVAYKHLKKNFSKLNLLEDVHKSNHSDYYHNLRLAFKYNITSFNYYQQNII